MKLYPKILSVFGMAALLCLVQACKDKEEDKVSVSGVKVSPEKVSMTEGESVLLDVEVFPDDASDKTVSWSSDDSETAAVNADGLVTALRPGKTKVCAVSRDGGFMGECEVEVLKKTVSVEGVSLDADSRTLEIGETLQLTATVAPENADNTDVSWSSGNDKVASVDHNGLVTAVSEGSTSIAVTTADGGKTASCAVNVISKKVHVESVSLSPGEMELHIGDEAAVTATVLPENADDKSLKWESSAPEIASVNQKGLVKALAEGDAVITAMSDDGGKTATCKVKCKTMPVTEIELDPTDVELNRGETFQLKWSVLPLGATNRKVVWTSSDESVATVSETGLVTAVKNGTADITVASDGKPELHKSCRVTVVTRVEKVVVEPAEVTMKVGESCTLSARIYPEDATCRTVSWRSSDESKITVDNDGKVIAGSDGVYEIYAAASDGTGERGKCIVTVSGGDEDVTSMFDSGFAALLKSKGYVNDAGAIKKAEVSTIRRLVLDNPYVGGHGSLMSLKGVGNFKSLEKISFHAQSVRDLSELDGLENLKEIDASQNLVSGAKFTGKALVRLDLSENRLTSLDVSGAVNLESLILSYNGLSSIDVTKNTALDELDIIYNKIGSLDLSATKVLSKLYVAGNPLSSIDLGGLAKLEYLNCAKTGVTSLDFSDNPQIFLINAPGSKLSRVNFGGSGAVLRVLNMKDCALESFDISGLTRLTEFSVEGNPGSGGKFVVKSWFDNSGIPYRFTYGKWNYGEQTVVIEYVK